MVGHWQLFAGVTEATLLSRKGWNGMDSCRMGGTATFKTLLRCRLPLLNKSQQAAQQWN